MSHRTLSYWESSGGLVATPRFDVPPRHTEVLIVGAGFCGSWLAYFLRKHHPSLPITILERDSFNLGASARNAGFLSCGNISEWLEDTRDLGEEEALRTFAARIDGIETILSELSGAMESEPCDSVDFDEVTPEKRALADRLNGFLRERGREPFFDVSAVRIGGKQPLAFVNRFDRAADPFRILSALHEALRGRDVHIVRGATVSRLQGGEASVVTTDGRVHDLTYGRAFLCVNAFSSRLNPGTDVRPARGQILVTSPCETDTRRCLGFLKSGYDYFRFIGDRVLVGGGRLNFRESENTDELSVTEELRRYLVDLACRVIGHERFTIDHHWSGIMGFRAGRHAGISALMKPIAIDTKTEELSSCGGWGVTLSPYVARARAEAFRP